MTALKPPLSVYVLHHLKSDSGKKVYEHIYKILCRDVEKPLFASRGIPVYLRTDVDSKILPIEFSASEKTIVFVIVDLYMYSSDKWEEYVKNILEEKKRTDKSVFVLPILLHDYAASFAGMQDLQGIKYSDNDVFRHLLDFEIRIYHFVIKVLTTKISNRLQIFISHAKKDGEDKAEGLRLYFALFGFNSIEIKNHASVLLLYSYKYLGIFLLGCLFATPIPRKIMGKIISLNKKFILVEYFLLLIILLFSVSCLVSNAYNPFIYFRF